MPSKPVDEKHKGEFICEVYGCPARATLENDPHMLGDVEGVLFHEFVCDEHSHMLGLIRVAFTEDEA